MRKRIYWGLLIILQIPQYILSFHYQGWYYFPETSVLLDALSAGLAILLIRDYLNWRRNRVVSLGKSLAAFLVGVALVFLLSIGYGAVVLPMVLYPLYLFVLIFVGWKYVFRKSDEVPS